MPPKRVANTGVPLAGLDDCVRFNAVCAEFLRSSVPPARAPVEVARLPRDAKAEVSAAAVRRTTTVRRMACP